MTVTLLEGGRKVHQVDAGPILVSARLANAALGPTRPVRVLESDEELVQLVPAGEVHLIASTKECGCIVTFEKPWRLRDPADEHRSGVLTVAQHPRIHLVGDELHRALTELQPDLVFTTVSWTQPS